MAKKSAAQRRKKKKSQAANAAPTQTVEKKPDSKPASKVAESTSRGRALSARLQWWLIIGVAASIVGFLVFNAVRDAADDGGDGVTTAEGWDLPVLDQDVDPEGRVRLADFAGTPTVVNFFASWCDACDDELPDFRETALELDGQVDFLFVNSNETGNWRPMAERHNIEQFTLVKDIQGTRRNGLYRSLRGTGSMPMTAFYDANGNLVDTVLSAMSASTLDQRLRGLGLI